MPFDITDITLSGVLPEVFADDDRRHRTNGSMVWGTGLVFHRNATYSVDAASGMGKSSLCAYIYGLRTDYLGTITFGGTDITRLSVNDWCAIRRTHLAYLPQGLDLFPGLSAFDNVLLKNRLTDFRSEAEIRAMFDRLGIADRISAPAGLLSVGQQQRVALIRALCQPFDFILLDEPVSHLDRDNNRECAALVAETARSLGAGIIATSVGNPLDLPQPITILRL